MNKPRYFTIPVHCTSLFWHAVKKMYLPSV